MVFQLGIAGFLKFRKAMAAIGRAERDIKAGHLFKQQEWRW